MFDRLKALYLAGKIDETSLDIAVNKHWIKEEEKLEIVASKKTEL